MKLATIKDIALQAGVSTSTVSRVINKNSDVSEKTRQRVLKIMKANNYLPSALARSLSTNQTKTIGIFGPIHPAARRTFHLNDPFFREILYGLEVSLGDAGYDLLYFTKKKKANYLSCIDLCNYRHVDGAVFLGFSGVISEIEKFKDSGLPGVFVDTEITGKNVTFVTSDNKTGAKLAVSYLYKLGHRKIAYIMGIENAKTTVDRLIGYKEALKEYKLELNRDWFVHSGGYTEEHGVKAMNYLLSLKSQPTGIFCTDRIAIGVIKAITNAGLKVPDDFSIVGTDDLEISRYLTPSLTTIHQYRYEIGKSAAEILLKMICKNKIIDHRYIPVEFIERDSCRKLS